MKKRHILRNGFIPVRTCNSLKRKATYSTPQATQEEIDICLNCEKEDCEGTCEKFTRRYKNGK